MQVRLYEIGNREGHVHRLEGFPVTLATGEEGDLCLSGNEAGQTRCVLTEVRGNIVIENCDERGEVFLNNEPIERGPLMPGDALRLGERAFRVSYERLTPEPPPPSRFRIAKPH